MHGPTRSTIAAITGSARRRCATAARWSGASGLRLDAGDRAPAGARHPQRTVAEGDRGGMRADVDPVRHLSIAGVDAHQRLLAGVRDPYGAVADRDARGGAPERDRLTVDAVRRGVDADQRLVVHVGNPHAALADSQLGGAVAGADVCDDAAAAGVDARDRRVAVVGYPHGSRPDREAFG